MKTSIWSYNDKTDNYQELMTIYINNSIAKSGKLYTHWKNFWYFQGYYKRDPEIGLIQTN